MTLEQANNLFSNFQSTVFRAIKTFLQRCNDEPEKQITTSLRIPNEIKNFYDCLAEAESTSFNTAIVNTLSKVKDCTINEYEKSFTKINDVYDYQINSIFKILDDSKIDYNDLCVLLSWIISLKVSRIEIANKERLINIVDKEAQLKLCKIFGYNYNWIQNNEKNIFYNWSTSENRWYKNVLTFVKNLIANFYLDETVKSFEVSFLCCDRNLVKNILSGSLPQQEESITPIVIAEREINGLSFKTYHKFESNNINYERCRSHFVVLIKLLLMLNKQRVVNFPSCYIIGPQAHDMVRDGNTHLSHLFNNTYLSSNSHLEDLNDLEPYSFSSDIARKTTKPNILHIADIAIMDNILDSSENNSASIALTDDLAKKCGMTKNALVKYLRLCNLDDYPNNIVSASNDGLSLNLAKIRELNMRIVENKLLDTSFG